jgi:hypothetical protein
MLYNPTHVVPFDIVRVFNDIKLSHPVPAELCSVIAIAPTTLQSPLDICRASTSRSELGQALEVLNPKLTAYFLTPMRTSLL